MKSEKKQKRLAYKNYLVWGILGILIYTYTKNDRPNSPPPPKKYSTHRLLVFVDVPLMNDLDSKSYRVLENGLHEWLIPQRNTSESENFLEKELYIFSLCSSAGTEILLDFHLDSNSIRKLSGRGYRIKKSQEFSRKYHNAFNDFYSLSDPLYRRVLQSSLTIRDFIRNHKPGDKNTIVYYSDLMQRDKVQAFENAQFNFTLLNRDLNGLYRIDEAGLETAIDQLRNTQSPLFKRYIKKIKPSFSQISSSSVEVILIGPHTEYNPSTHLKFDKENVRQFWTKFFKEAELIDNNENIKIYPPNNTWAQELNSTTGS